MPTRNTVVLQRIIEALGDDAPPDALARLEAEFQSSLLIVAGTVEDVARHAEKLRLAITEQERPLVLDYIAKTSVAQLTIDHVEDAINSLWTDRFIEP
ncbi:MAG: hypothetical protein ABMA13_00800 [Chthoniobacteraceae bacterium]